MPFSSEESSLSTKYGSHVPTSQIRRSSCQSRKKAITIRRERNMNSSWAGSPRRIVLATAMGLLTFCGTRRYPTHVSAFVVEKPSLVSHNCVHPPRSSFPTTKHPCFLRPSSEAPKISLSPVAGPASFLSASRENNDPYGSSGSDADADRLSRPLLALLAVVGWPLAAAYGIPSLVDTARSLPPNSPDQIAAVTVLIVVSRVILYGVAATIVATAAIRSQADPDPLGQRLTALTEELVVPQKQLPVAVRRSRPEAAPETTSVSPPTVSTTTPIEPSFVQKLVDSSGLEENLDGVDAGTQALVLPVLVSSLLAVSVFTLPFFSSPGETLESTMTLPGLEWVSTRLTELLPLVSQAWNALLLTLFCRAEFRRLGNELLGGIFRLWTDEEDDNTVAVPTPQIVVECLLAVAVTLYGAYFLQYWPAQNFCNAAIAVLVARAIRLDSLGAVTLALTLLVVYDASSVLLVPAASALDGTGETVHLVASAASPNPAAASAMGSVAMQKLGGNTFQPGLLVTKLDGTKLTGTLGLGDAVFPSLMASFLKRFDEDGALHGSNNKPKSKKSRLFEASLAGYLVGCLACELAPNITTRGVPALVWIIPSMGLATIFAAVRQGCLADLLRYNSINNNENINNKAKQ